MDDLSVIKTIEKVLGTYEKTGEPKWTGQSDNENRATAIFQKLRDLGVLETDKASDARWT